MKLVGITGFKSDHRNVLNNAYINAFTRSNITPVVIPEFKIQNLEFLDKELMEKELGPNLNKIADSLDGLVISGGVDINPVIYENINGDRVENSSSYSCDFLRDISEVLLLEKFLERNKPVMGICRGFQLIGQHIGVPNFQQSLSNTSEFHTGTEKDLKNRQEAAHAVHTFGNYRKFMQRKAGNNEAHDLLVNSWHHQGFTITADGKSPDRKDILELKSSLGLKKEDVFGWSGWFEHTTNKIEQDAKINILAATDLVIEAFEQKEKNIFAVQWHPEEYGPTGKTIDYFVSNFLDISKKEEKKAKVILAGV